MGIKAKLIARKVITEDATETGKYYPQNGSVHAAMHEILKNQVVIMEALVKLFPAEYDRFEKEI